MSEAISYTYNGQRQTIDQYLDKHPVTGLLIAKGDSILVVVALLIGIAVSEGAVRSIDERAEAYVPELKGTEYGRTPIKALLQMSSGVAFREDYTDMTSDIAELARATLGQEPGGGLAAVTRFNTRNAEPGQRGLGHEESRRTARRSCMAIVCGCSPDRAGSFRCAAFGGSSSSWIPDRGWCWCKPRRARLASGRGVVCALGRATVAVAPVARRRRRDDNPV